MLYSKSLISAIKKKKIKVDDLKKEPIISLEEDSKQLEEVVVVGYGIQKRYQV